MYLITDTCISKEHFVPVPFVEGDIEQMVAFQCKVDELVHMRRNLLEWARQLEEEIKARGVEELL